MRIVAGESRAEWHTGTQALPFGPRMRAVPLSSLWEMAAHSTAE